MHSANTNTATVFCALARTASSSGRTRENNDSDDKLEHAALQLWLELCQQQHHQSPTNASPTLGTLVAADNKTWNRIAKLLFVSSDHVARSIAAVMSAAVGVTSACTATHADKHTKSQRSVANERVCNRIWCTDWWPRVLEKLQDCSSSSVASVGLRAAASQQNTAICEHLLAVVGAVLEAQAYAESNRASISASKETDIDNVQKQEATDPRLSSVIELVVTLSTSQTMRIASSATHVLTTALQCSQRYENAIATCFAAALAQDAVTLEHMTQWLAQTITLAAVDNNTASDSDAVERETLTCQCAYVELLTATTAASITTASHDQAALFVLYNVLRALDVLSLCTALLSHTQPAIQERALCLLDALVQMSVAAASLPSHAFQQASALRGGRSSSTTDICSTIRVSGSLITICWLIGHAHVSVASAALALLHIVIECSPASDIVRALLEQGCALILAAVARPPEPQPRSGATTSHSGGDEGSSSAALLLQWIATAIVDEHVLGAAATSVVCSRNALLQKNVLLSLLLLSPRSAVLQKALTRQPFHALDHPMTRDDGNGGDDSDRSCFVDSVVAVAIDANDDGRLAALVLAATLSWCDESSTLKLDDAGRSAVASRQSSSKQLTELVGAGTGAAAVNSSSNSAQAPAFVALAHGSDIVAHVQCDLLFAHSKVARRWLDTAVQQEQSQQVDSTRLTLQLEAFGNAGAIALFAQVLDATQPQAAQLLAQQSTSALLVLLALSHRLESTRSWHFATFALARALDASNWFTVFDATTQDGGKLRHPSLARRAVRVGLAQFDELPASRRLVADLQTVALRCYTALLYGSVDQ